MHFSITLTDHPIDFYAWHPGVGCLFPDGFAFDTETTAIDDERKWRTPAYVLGAACDGNRGVFVSRADLPAFFAAHRNVPWRMHNAPFDLAVTQVVLQKASSRPDVYELVEDNLVWDTQLLHRLHLLGAEGRDGSKESALSHCVQTHLGLDLPKDVKDSAGRDVRVGFDRFLNRPIAEIDPIYLDYLAKDALATHLLYDALRPKLWEMLRRGYAAFGYVSHDWLRDCVRRFGPQTHHVQLKGAIVLREITANGLTIDQSRSDELRQALDASGQELRERLKREWGYQPGQKGCGKALQDILQRIEMRNGEERLPRTAKSGAYAVDEESLSTLADREPFIRDLIAFRSVEKLQKTFVDKFIRRVLHPAFNPLVRTGRTSSFGEINAQNLPRDERIRNCFVAPPGRVYIDADYAAVEMATLAQSVIGQLGVQSTLGDAINAGLDPHRLVAAEVTGKTPNEITKEERQRAKAINFGKPGGMGNPTLQSYARVSYGVDLDEQQVADLSDAWFTRFPEMRNFLHEEEPYGAAVAKFFDLTPAAHFAHTDSNRFLAHRDNRGCEDTPHPMLGSMLLKVFTEPHPRRRTGGAYSGEEIDYFWSAAIAKVELLPRDVRADVLARRPSLRLQQAVRSYTDRGSVFTLTGRLRANASFCARHNTVFQGLAADGAKLALWKLWRAGYSIHNFIHDEVLVSVPTGPTISLHAEIVKQLMIRGMQEVVPDVRISMEYVVTERWSKDAKLVRDDAGRVIAWRPETTQTESPPEPVREVKLK